MRLLDTDMGLVFILVGVAQRYEALGAAAQTVALTLVPVTTFSPRDNEEFHDRNVMRHCVRCRAAKRLFGAPILNR